MKSCSNNYIPYTNIKSRKQQRIQNLVLERQIFLGLTPPPYQSKSSGPGEGLLESFLEVLVKNREFRGYLWSFLYLISFGTVSNAISKENFSFLENIT